MRLSTEARRLSRQLFKSSFSNGRLDFGKVRALTQSIIESKPRHYIAVLKDYHRLLRLELEKQHAIVESAEPISASEGTRLLQMLRARHGAETTVEFRVNPTLLGGLRIRLGSNVWDGTVRARLSRLEEQFTIA